MMLSMTEQARNALLKARVWEAEATKADAKAKVHALKMGRFALAADRTAMGLHAKMAEGNRQIFRMAKAAANRQREYARKLAGIAGLDFSRLG